MLPNEVPANALDRLLQELENHRAKEGPHRESHYVSAFRPASRVLLDVPLLHGTNGQGFDGTLSSGSLRSRQALGKPPSEVESYLRLPGVVYSSAGILYPARDFAFVLSPAIEQSIPAEACPWDSGAMSRSLCGSLLPAMPGPERREVFLAHTLPAPQYRQYLVHYVASCFRSAPDYLHGRPHRFSDPLGALCETIFSRVFEVRLGADIPVEPWTLEAVFMVKDGLGTRSLRLRRRLEALEQAGVKIFLHDAAERQLRWVVADWMVSRVGAAASGGST